MESIQRIGDAVVGKHDVDAGCELQRPAPVSDPHGGDHLLGQAIEGLERREQIGGVLAGALANHEGKVGIGFAHGWSDHGPFGIDHIGLAAGLPHGEGDALLNDNLERRRQETHDLCVLNPRHLLEPLFGGVGVEGEHQGSRASAKGVRQLHVGGALLALHGDALHAKAGSDGDGFGATLGLAIKAVLSAHPKSIAPAGGHQKHGDDAPGTAAAVERGPARAPLGLAESRQGEARKLSGRHGDAAREQRVGRFP